jgi:XTP/dITP diphosphohydrolase
MRLLIATRSRGKASEIRELFVGLPYALVFPADLGLSRLIEEGELEAGSSYAENAVAKARYFATRSGLSTCADDSGLEVDALGGAPGVHSARFARLEDGGISKESADAANNALLLEKLAGVPEGRRTARYRCVLAYLRSPTAVPELVEASCEGYIVAVPRGQGGFGYDPLFYATELRMTFGEAPRVPRPDRGTAAPRVLTPYLRSHAPPPQRSEWPSQEIT